MKSLVTIAILLHLAFLLSIFYIYFRTIIVEDLRPLRSLNNPPAKRLILLVSDGLRAESFFEDNCSRTPFLKRILLERGIIGVSHTHVPTESRPGHVALIAGVYEDPSSIFRGWRENPVHFDSLFNRSTLTYAWGSPDIVPMFSRGASEGRVKINTYDANDEHFGAGAPTHLLDKWVFDRVHKFLSSEGAKLRDQDGLVMFLHLLGMDTSGHVHKPQSETFAQNLRFVDAGIEKFVQLVDATFGDNRTAFVFTSDHGMTNRGSHGAGHPHETETPFLVWGAGVNHWREAQRDFVTRTRVQIDGESVPRYDIQQADAAPLMATLIGAPVPVNSLGKLPYMYPNVSKAYLASAFANNAYQLHAMYRKLHEQALRKTFKFAFNMRESRLEDDIDFLDEQIKLSFTINDYDDVIVKSHELIKSVYIAIDYFQMYYKSELLISLTLAMLGWIALLYQYVLTSRLTLRLSKRIFITGTILIILIIVYNLLQHAPTVVIGYFCLPVLIWMLVFANKCENFVVSPRHIGVGLVCIAFAELLVYSFFERRVLSLALILYTGSITAYAVRKKLEPKLKTLKYFSSAVCLGIFPLLRVVDKDNRNSLLLALGAVFWIFRSMDYVYLKRASRVSVIQTALLFAGGLFVLYVVFHLEAGNALERHQQVISWLLLASPWLIALGPTDMEIRMKLIGNGFSVAYLLMSVSYEPLFLLAFFVHVYSWIEMELIVFRRGRMLKDFDFATAMDERRRALDFNDIRCVLVFLLYLLISFFGTGNMATVSSFDPNWVRCLVVVFSPFLMTLLIVFKLAIPIKLLSCSFRAIHVALRVDTRKTFVIMLIVCDIMCINFLFLVRNKGSWLDIGTSLSHFVIMEATVVILILFYGLAQLITSCRILGGREMKLE